MKSLGQNPSEAELQDMVQVLDSDGNGTVEFQEIIDTMSKMIKLADLEDERKQVFRLFDRDGDGFISETDLKAVLDGFGDIRTMESVAAMIKDADCDADGMVSYQEFLRVLTVFDDKSKEDTDWPTTPCLTLSGPQTTVGSSSSMLSSRF